MQQYIERQHQAMEDVWAVFIPLCGYGRNRFT